MPVVYPDFIRSFLTERSAFEIARRRRRPEFLMRLNSFLESSISRLWKRESNEAEALVVFWDVRYFSECELLNLRAGGVLCARWLMRNCDLWVTIEDDFAPDMPNVTENMIWDPLRTFVLNFALSKSGEICLLEFIDLMETWNDPFDHCKRRETARLGPPLIAPLVSWYARDPRDRSLPPNWRPRAVGR